MWIRVKGRVAEQVGYSDPDCEIVAVNLRMKVLVLKEPGQKYWAARGVSRYAAAQYSVQKIEEVKIVKEGRMIRVESLNLSWPVRVGENSDDAQFTLDKINAIFNELTVTHTPGVENED